MEPISLEDFREILIREIERVEDKFNIHRATKLKTDSDAFVLWAATQLIGINEDNAKRA